MKKLLTLILAAFTLSLPLAAKGDGEKTAGASGMDLSRKEAPMLAV